MPIKKRRQNAAENDNYRRSRQHGPDEKWENQDHTEDDHDIHESRNVSGHYDEGNRNEDFGDDEDRDEKGSRKGNYRNATHEEEEENEDENFDEDDEHKEKTRSAVGRLRSRSSRKGFGRMSREHVHETGSRGNRSSGRYDDHAHDRPEREGRTRSSQKSTSSSGGGRRSTSGHPTSVKRNSSSTSRTSASSRANGRSGNATSKKASAKSAGSIKKTSNNSMKTATSRGQRGKRGTSRKSR